jgi:hypothetical protein
MLEDRGMSPNKGRCIISYQEVLSFLLRNVHIKQMRLALVITV